MGKLQSLSADRADELRRRAVHSLRSLVLEFFEGVLDVSWHQAFKSAVLAIPLECNTVTLFGIPVDREFVDF